MSTTSTSSSTLLSNLPTPNFQSQYASDFQAILSKAEQVDQIPVTQLQTQDSAILSQESALSSVNTAVANLSTSLNSLQTLAANQALGATSSDSSVVSVTATGATKPAAFTINSITSVASAASETSQTSYADASTTPVSSTGSMELVVGSQKFDFSLTSSQNNLTGLVSEINSLSGTGVTASVLTAPTGDYLSIAANSTGATTLQLIDDPITATNPAGANQNILTDANQGSDAKFQLNGINIDQASNTVNNIIPGVTFNILDTTPSTAPVTLSLATDPTQISSALQDFVTNYNALSTALAGQTGTSGGALVGDTVINQLQQTLEHLTSTYTTSGTVHSLADMGVDFSDTGQASFNQTTFNALSTAQISDACTFLNSSTNGIGGYSSALSQFSDPVNGLIQSEQSGLQQTDTQLQDQMNTLNSRITTELTALTTQLEASDTAQFNLQTQQQELSASLQGLDLVLYGKNLNQS